MKENLRLVQVHSAGSPGGKGRATLSVSVRVPIDFAKALGLQRGDFMLASVNGKTLELHVISATALVGLLQTVEKEVESP